MLSRVFEKTFLEFQDAVINCIVRVVSVDRETVIDRVSQNNCCDDLAAIYHMIEQNYKDIQVINLKKLSLNLH